MLAEVFVAIRGNTLRGFQDELEKDEPNAETRSALPYLSDEIDTQVWLSLPGNQLGMTSIVEESEIPGMHAGLGGDPTQILGAWKQDGLQVGVEYVYDENGEVTGTTGTPTYEQVGGLLDQMIPGGRGNQHHRYAGWSDRIY